jgi:hypothetical protein
MTRLRNLVMGGLAALAIGGTASSALALEPASFDNRLNGATVGLPLGALPPAGLYTGLETAYLGWPGSGSGNRAAGLYLPAVAQAVPLLYVPGWHFLGATYGMSAVVAFYNGTVLTGSTSHLGSEGGTFQNGGVGLLNYYAVFANPLWNPIALSWNLGGGWFVSAGFNFMAPIGTHYTGTPNPDYWTFEPTFAISYLANNWVLSANMFYDFNTASKGTCCAQLTGFDGGEVLYVDMTAAYKFGKWEFGPVGYVEVQTTGDNFSGCSSTPSPCGKYENFAAGGLIGYDFGPVDIQVWVTDSIHRDNAIDGLDVWSRIGFRLWAPEAPVAPLVTKN